LIAENEINQAYLSCINPNPVDVNISEASVINGYNRCKKIKVHFMTFEQLTVNSGIKLNTHKSVKSVSISAL